MVLLLAVAVTGILMHHNMYWLREEELDVVLGIAVEAEMEADGRVGGEVE